MAWNQGTSTVGGHTGVDISGGTRELIKYLVNTPERRIEQGLAKYYKTGVFDRDSEFGRNLEVKRPLEYLAITSGKLTPEEIKEMAGKFFEKEETTPALATEQDVLSSLAPPAQPPVPAQLLPLVSQGPTLDQRPEFQLPTYNKPEISPGWQGDYTNQMVDILTQPRTTTTPATEQDQGNIITGLLASGDPKAKNVADFLTGLRTKSTPEWKPTTEEKWRETEEFKAGLKPEGKLTGDAFKIDYLEKQGILPEEIIKRLYSDKEGNKLSADAQLYFDLHGKKPTPQEFIAWKKQLAEATGTPAKAPYMSPGLQNNLDAAVQAIATIDASDWSDEKKRKSKDRVYQRLSAKYPNDASRIKTILYPEKLGFFEALMER